MLKIYIYWHKCWCYRCGTTSEDSATQLLICDSLSFAMRVEPPPSQFPCSQRIRYLLLCSSSSSYSGTSKCQKVCTAHCTLQPPSSLPHGFAFLLFPLLLTTKTGRTGQEATYPTSTFRDYELPATYLQPQLDFDIRTTQFEWRSQISYMVFLTACKLAWPTHLTQFKNFKHTIHPIHL